MATSSQFLSQLKETTALFGLNLKVKWFNLIEFIRLFFRYYGNDRFLKIDLSLLAAYFLRNPFKISKQFLFKKGESEVYTYGETPLTTLDLIAQTCRISPKDTVYELGCGRGRTCFWLHEFIGCRVVGVDYVPTFIEKAQYVQQQFHVSAVSFKCEDFFHTDLQNATVIYFYGTCSSNIEISKLIDRFSQLAKGTQIITVSYALTDYQPTAPFEILKRFSAPFTWGEADVYLQVKS